MATSEAEPQLPVTVAIPSWRRPSWLRLCLRGVLGQSPCAAEVIVVGRAGDAETRAVAEEFAPRVRWVTVDRAGFVEPLRAAVAAATSAYLAVIDDDAEPASSDWLSNLFDVASLPGVGCAGSRVINDGERAERVRSSAGRISWFGRVAGNTGSRTDVHPVDLDMLPEGNWMWRIEVLRGLTIASIWDNDDASMYGVDLCQQSLRRGWRVVYTSDAPILHHIAPRLDPSTNRADRPARMFSYTRNSTYLALRHFGWRLIPFAIWSTLIGDSSYLGAVSAVRASFRGQLPRSVLVASIRGRSTGASSWWRERGLAKRSFNAD